MKTEGALERELAAKLIAHARTDAGAANRGSVGAAATAFQRMSAELSRWLGESGCHALLTRALKKAAADHPALSGVELVTGSYPRLGLLTELVEANGPDDVRAGLESALVALFELLGRLIGDDLSMKLAELSMTNGVLGAAHTEGERAPQR